MSDPPSKRRKTTPDATATENVNNNAPPLQFPVTHRQSFQSPTRSSLARSNPEVLSHVLARSPIRSPLRQSQGTSFGLRDRKALRPSLATNTEFSSPSRARALSQSPRRGAVIAGAQQQAIAVPPRRISRRIESPRRNVARDGEERDNGEQQIQIAEREQTTPARQVDPDEQLASELDSATRELEHSGLLAPSSFNDDLPEPELPPTPTQVSREKRLKAAQDIHSSPRVGRTLRRELFRPSKLGVAPAEDIQIDEDEDLDDPAIRRKVKRELLEQLDQLKADVALLENWTNRAKLSHDGQRAGQEDISNLISLLASVNKTTDQTSESTTEQPPISTLISSLLPFSAKAVPITNRAASPEPINAFALSSIPHPTPYITAFASLDLQHSTSLSVSSSPEGAITETHEISLSAPRPFPPNQFVIPLQFTTDLQSQRITSISLSKDGKIPPTLQTWIESRISSPVVGLDISGLCFGINRFWEASVSRARLWSRLRKCQELLSGAAKKKSKRFSDIDSEEENLTGPLKTSDLRYILPHLRRSSMLFSSSPPRPAAANLPGSSSKSTQRESKLILSCPLSLDPWTSEAQLKPDISIHISNLAETQRRKVEAQLKRLFHSVLREGSSSNTRNKSGSLNEEREVQGIVRAVEGVMGVLFGVDLL